MAFLILRMARIFVDPKKIEAIVNWERLKTVTEIRNFLGLSRFFFFFGGGGDLLIERQLYEK